MDLQSNPDSKETMEANQPVSQEEAKPLFSGVDSQGKERLFGSVEEAQKSWQSSQDFIKDKVTETKTMEARIQELEAKLNQSTKLEDALSQLKNKEESPVNEPQQHQTTETTPQLDSEQLEQQILEKVMGKLTSSQQEQVFAQNQSESISAAQAVYGEDFENKLRQRASELDMSDEDIINESRQNPKRFKTLFGLDKQTKSSLSPSTSFTGKMNTTEEFKLNSSGFSASDKLSSHRSNLESMAKKLGYSNLKF